MQALNQLTLGSITSYITEEITMFFRFEVRTPEVESTPWGYIMAMNPLAGEMNNNPNHEGDMNHGSIASLMSGPWKKLYTCHVHVPTTTEVQFQK